MRWWEAFTTPQWHGGTSENKYIEPKFQLAIFSTWTDVGLQSLVVASPGFVWEGGCTCVSRFCMVRPSTLLHYCFVSSIPCFSPTSCCPLCCHVLVNFSQSLNSLFIFIMALRMRGPLQALKLKKRLVLLLSILKRPSQLQLVEGVDIGIALLVSLRKFLEKECRVDLYSMEHGGALTRKHFQTMV